MSDNTDLTRAIEKVKEAIEHDKQIEHARIMTGLKSEKDEKRRVLISGLGNHYMKRADELKEYLGHLSDVHGDRKPTGLQFDDRTKANHANAIVVPSSFPDLMGCFVNRASHAFALDTSGHYEKALQQYHISLDILMLALKWERDPESVAFIQNEGAVFTTRAAKLQELLHGRGARYEDSAPYEKAKQVIHAGLRDKRLSSRVHEPEHGVDALRKQQESNDAPAYRSQMLRSRVSAQDSIDCFTLRMLPPSFGTLQQRKTQTAKAPSQ